MVVKFKKKKYIYFLPLSHIVPSLCVYALFGCSCFVGYVEDGCSPWKGKTNRWKELIYQWNLLFNHRCTAVFVFSLLIVHRMPARRCRAYTIRPTLNQIFFYFYNKIRETTSNIILLRQQILKNCTKYLYSVRRTHVVCIQPKTHNTTKTNIYFVTSYFFQ